MPALRRLSHLPGSNPSPPRTRRCSVKKEPRPARTRPYRRHRDPPHQARSSTRRPTGTRTSPVPTCPLGPRQRPLQRQRTSPPTSPQPPPADQPARSHLNAITTKARVTAAGLRGITGTPHRARASGFGDPQHGTSSYPSDVESIRTTSTEVVVLQGLGYPEDDLLMG